MLYYVFSYFRTTLKSLLHDHFNERRLFHKSPNNFILLGMQSKYVLFVVLSVSLFL